MVRVQQLAGRGGAGLASQARMTTCFVVLSARNLPRISGPTAALRVVTEYTVQQNVKPDPLEDAQVGLRQIAYIFR